MTTDTISVLDQNLQTVRSWIEQASDGFFTLSEDRGHSGRLSIVRSDGVVVRDGGGHDISGVFVHIFISSSRKFDRRFKNVQAQVLDGLRFARKHLLSDAEKNDGDPEGLDFKIWLTAHNWARRNGVKEV